MKFNNVDLELSILWAKIVLTPLSNNHENMKRIDKITIQDPKTS